ncbi:MAG: hypothetical protein R3F49_14820 [Planctomycetota bacterium]
MLRFALSIAMAVLASCASTSYPYHFEPSPAEVQVQANASGPQLARVLIGVIGAERQGQTASGHPDLLVRLRIEAKGPGTLRFVPASAKVLGPDLAAFGPARLEDGADTAAVIEIASGEARDLALRFAFPRDGDLRMPRLTGVNVSLTLDTAAGAKELSVSLSRNAEGYDRSDRYRYGAGPYWGYPYSGWRFGYTAYWDC